MPEDISITIKADPTQAVRSINQVKSAGDELAETSEKVNRSAASDTTQAMNQVLSVGRTARREFEQTGAAVNSIGSGVKSAATEAAKVSGAFGQAVPVVGRLGSAIASAITGPIGAVSAAIGLAIAGIQKMIAEMEARVERLKLSAGTQTSSAYDALVKGRSDYAAQLQVLAQVRELHKLAQESALSSNDLASFRSLASQVGIEEKHVTERGIKSGKLAEAERSLQQQRAHYAEQEYQDYLDAMQKQLIVAVGDSSLNAEAKDRLLKSGSLQRMADTITQRARSGSGNTLEDYKAWQDLYGIVKQHIDVRESYARDAMLGRSQAELNAAAIDSVRAHAEKAAPAAGPAEGPGGGSSSSPWMEAARVEQDRIDKLKEINQKLDQEQQIQQLINDGKEREAYLLRNRISTEASIGRTLTESEYRDLASRAGMLYDLQHPAEPELSPPEPGSPARSARRAAPASADFRDRLQRIGAKIGSAAISPEKLVMDKQLSVQEDIRRILAATQLNHPDTSIMRF